MNKDRALLSSIMPFRRNILFISSLLFVVVLGVMTSTLTTSHAVGQDPGSSTDLPTMSPTPQPFECSKLRTSWGAPPFDLNNLQFFVNNINQERVELKSVEIKWNDIAAPWNNMYLGVMALDDDVHWLGSAAQNIKANGQTSVTTGQLTTGYRIITAESSAVWTGTFFNGPVSMEDYLTLYDFGAHFTFSSQSGVICDVVLLMPGDTTPTPTATTSSDCPSVDDRISLKFGGFGSYGGVWFTISNNTGRDVFLTGFDLVWPDAAHPQITGEPVEGYGLAKVIIGGDNVLAPNGQRVWQADPPVKPGNTNLAPPYNNRTDSAQKGIWLGNGILPPGTTRVYLDFDSFSGRLSDFGAIDAHFDRSRFRVSRCNPETPEATETPTSTPTTTATPTPTSTEPIPEASATVTPEVPTMVDVTPTMDASATPSTELIEILPNTSFEIDTDGDKVPDGWTAKDPYPESRDKLQCDAESDKVRTGLCAYRFKANPDRDTSTLSFKTSAVDLAEIVRYEFSSFVYSTRLTPDMLLGKAKFTFIDGSAETIKLYPEEPYSFPEPLAAVGQFDLAGRTLKKITVQFRFPALYGKLWLDDVSLKVNANSNTLLDLQPLP